MVQGMFIQSFTQDLTAYDYYQVILDAQKRLFTDTPIGNGLRGDTAIARLLLYKGPNVGPVYKR